MLSEQINEIKFGINHRNPLDVGTVCTTPVITYTFHETSVYKAGDPQRSPWTIQLKDAPGNQDVLACPDLKYFFHMEIPTILKDPTNPLSTFVYSIDKVQFYDKNGAQIGMTISNPPTTSDGYYDFEVVGATSPAFTAVCSLKVDCDGGFGLSNFVGQYRAYCNDDCSSLCNYNVYGESTVILHRHCYGDCNGIYVSTKNFNVKRVTKGWLSEATYLADPSLPDADDNSILKDRVYPCDEVKITSTDGIVSKLPNGGIPNLEELYFAMLIDENQLSAANLNLFDGLSTANSSFFTIKAKNGTGGPCDNITFNIPINWSDITFIPSSPNWKPNYRTIQFKLNGSYTDPNSTCSLTALDLLKNYECTLSIEAFLITNNLKLDVITGPSAFIELKAMFGEFCYKAVGQSLIHHSCDPYIQNFTYLQIAPVFDHEFFGGPAGQNQQYTTSQCELLYALNMKVKGGYPLDDDFPNEFRPSIVFPTTFLLNHKNNLSVTSTEFIDDNRIPANYIYVNTNNTIKTDQNGTIYTESTLESTGNILGYPIDKDGTNYCHFVTRLWRECAITDPIIQPQPPSTPLSHYLDLRDNLIAEGLWYPGCDDAIGANSFIGNFDNVSQPLPQDYFDESLLKLTWNQSSPYTTLEHPATLPFTLEYMPNITGTRLCQNVWITFKTMNNSVLNPMEYDLFDITTGTQIAVPYQVAQTLLNTPKYFLIDEVLQGQPRKYQLIAKWKSCFSPDPFKIEAEYGVYCNKAGFPSDIDIMPMAGSLPGNSCSTILHSNEFDLFPPTDDIIASVDHNGAEENRKDCQTYKFEYKVDNRQGDLSSARVRLQLPEIPIQGFPSCVLSLLNVSVEINSINYQLSIPTATYLSGGGNNFWIYEWDIIQILINNFGSPHFNSQSLNKLIFHFELMIQSNLAVNISPPSIVNFTCSTLYNSTCDQQQVTSSLAGPENDFFYYSGTPLPAFSIFQSAPYCSSGTNVNLAVIPSAASFTYLWSQGASTSNNINVTAFGNYTVTITSSTCASSVVVHHLVENNTINLSLTSNPSNSCSASPFYTIENSSDPGTGVVGQPLYSYIWSYPGGASSSNYPYITPSGSGTGPFNVVVSHNGCTSTGSINIPNVTPSFTINGGGTYCGTSSPTLSVNFGSYSPPLGSIVTYYWNTGATTPTIAATAPKNGGVVNYSVTVTVDGCSSSANVNVTNLTPEAVISFDDHMQGYCSTSQINVHSLYQGTYFTYNWSANPASTSGSSSSYMLDVNSYLTLPPSIDITLEIDNQGCIVSTTKSLNDITPSILINSPYSHANVCPGDNVNLNAVVLPNTFGGGNILYNYLWNDGVTTSSNSVFPPGNPQQWLYTVTVTNQHIHECNSQQSFQIVSMDPKVLFVPPVIPIPPGGAASLVPMISNLNPGFSSYYWTWGTSPVPLTPTETDPQQTVNPSATTTYYLDFIAYDPFGISPPCSSSAAVTVAITGNIACPGTGYTLLTQDILNGSQFYNSGTNVVALPSNTHWWVKDQLYIGGPNLVLGADIEIVFSKGSGITIASNHNLQADEGCVMRACGSEMWDGIYMQPNSQIRLTGPTGHPVLIEDAEHGIFAAGSNIHITCLGDVTFNKNYVGVHLENGNFNSAIFDRTKFTCSAQLLAPHAAIGYSYRHAELINAGIVNFNTGGSYVSNLFENAYTSIYSKNTSVNVMSCNFINSALSSQPNYIGTAIDFNVRTWPGMTSVPTLNVGQANTSLIPNQFEDFELSIGSSGRAHVNIIGNVITSGNQAIRLRNNSSLPSYLEGDIYVSGNIINNVISAGIILSNNQYTRTTILNNSINPNMVNFPVNPLLETANGIFIHNATPTTSEVKELFVQWNSMVNCKNGIHVMNHNGGHLENNLISYLVEDNGVRNSTTTFRRGIKLEGCKNLSISHNTISRPLNSIFTLDANMVDISSSQVVSLCGIFSGSSQNCTFTNNILNHLPTGFHLIGDNADNKFNCNHLFGGIEGFKLANVFMTNQGSPTSACGNDWVAWPNGISLAKPEFTRIMGTGIPNHPAVKWYQLAVNSDHDPVQGVFYNPALPPFIFQDLKPISTCDDQPCFDCEVDRLHSLISFADTALIEEALKYAIENYVYTNLKDSMQLMYGGTIWDASLQNFFTLKAMSNLGLLNDVENLLTRDEYATSYLLNNEIETKRLVENNLYEVNRICAAYNNEFDSLSIDDRMILESIAYQFPDIGGTAVYRARAILGIEIDDSQLQYRLSTNDSSIASTKIILYPNPARDFLNIQIANKYPESKLQVSIYNVFGNIVDSKIISDVRINSQIDISKFLDGMYLIKINDDENCLFSGKFVKIAKK